MAHAMPSIFNDILGPVMIGPSSSHTCGPSRIGYLCRQLCEGRLVRAQIAFARAGAYARMYRGHRSDRGFVNGLMGNQPDDPAFRTIFEQAAAAGLTVDFVITDDLPVERPNLARITLWDEAGNKTVVDTDSTGGGSVELFAINGLAVSITGDVYGLLVFTDRTGAAARALYAVCQAIAGDGEGSSLSEGEGGSLLYLKARQPFTETQRAAIAAQEGVRSLRQLMPVLKVTANCRAALPFRTGADLLARAAAQRKPLWELAIDYECARSGMDREAVLDGMAEVIAVMETGVREALKSTGDLPGILRPSAGAIDRFIQQDSRALDMGLLATMVPWAMTVMEHSSAMGTVVCAPTGGSAGVFPGAVLGAAHALGLSEEAKCRLMLTTAITGVVIAGERHFSAELYGCQIEPGTASAMAASALAYLMGGTPEQSLMAASCAIQNILGIVCDPVAGLVQLPCISRNVSAVANALTSAVMVMGGYDPLIPLDEAAETLFRVGSQLPPELRCTCRGGLCTTPTGKRLANARAESTDRSPHTKNTD